MRDEGFVCGYYDKNSDKIINYPRETILFHYLYTHQAATYVKRVSYDDENYFTVRIDINFSISWQEDVDGEIYTVDILKHTIYVDYLGLRYKILSPEYFLLQLCLHSFRDMNSIVLIYNNKYVLRLLCDVFYYIVGEQNKIDFDRFIDIAKKYRYERQIYYIFYYISKEFKNDPIVEYVKSQLNQNSHRYVNYFGLSEEEMKMWNIDFTMRVTCGDISKYIVSSLNTNDLNKINTVIENMWI